MRYELTKLSSPGYTFETTHQKLIYSQLESAICTDCLNECESVLKRKEIKISELWNYSEKYADLTDSAINQMLMTSCGVEFYLEELQEKEK